MTLKFSQWLLEEQGRKQAPQQLIDLLAKDKVLEGGIYRMNFNTKAYFDSNNESGFYPYVDIVFELDSAGSHYHIPLLLTAFGYSTYRGS